MGRNICRRVWGDANSHNIRDSEDVYTVNLGRTSTGYLLPVLTSREPSSTASNDNGKAAVLTAALD